MRTATFHSQITIAKQSEKLSQLVSKASQEDDLKDLRKLLPKKEDVEDDARFVHFAGPAAVANLVNLNGTGILAETAVAIQKSWARNPVNIEHDRSYCIGYLTDSGFSTFADNKVITAEEALATDGPVNITVSGLLWRIAHGGYMTDLIEDCDEPDSDNFHDLSISWELAFSEFFLALDSKNLSKATLLKEDEEISKYIRYVRGEVSDDGYVGNGFDPSGREVYLVVAGSPSVIGIGLTKTPAASLRGIVTTHASTEPKDAPASENSNSAQTENQTNISISSQDLEKNEDFCKKVEEIVRNISLSQKNNVSKDKIMEKITNRFEALQLITEASSQRAFNDWLTQEFKTAEDAYLAEVKAKDKKIEDTEAEALASKQKVEELTQELAALQTKFQEIEDQVAQDRKQNVLESRVTALAAKYSLDEKLQKFVVKQIRDLDDTAYASWLEEADSLLSLSGQKEKVDAVDATEALREAKASVTIPNAQEIAPKNEYGNLTNLFGA